MSIQSFTEKLLEVMDVAFAREANNLLNEARNQTDKTGYIAGRMDGMTETAKLVQETYSLFVKSEEDKDENDDKPLY